MSAPRLMTAMITPYDENLEVNYAKTAELAKYLADNGSEGIVVSGTTGESPVLTKEEKISLLKVVKDAVGDRVKVWIGTGSNNTRQSIEMSREAEKLGADGVMAVCPYYNKPTQEGLYQHFKAIAESVSLPVMLYNVPGRTASNLLPETAAKLADIENITAIKEASGDLDQVSKLIRLLPDRVLVYSGDDSLTLPIMSLGGYGVISIASHLVGNDIKEMIYAFVSGDVKKASKLHLDLFPLFKGLFVTTNPIPVKEALNLKGFEVGGFRLPLTRIGEKENDFLVKLLKEYNLI